MRFVKDRPGGFDADALPWLDVAGCLPFSTLSFVASGSKCKELPESAVVELLFCPHGSPLEDDPLAEPLEPPLMELPRLPIEPLSFDSQEA